MISYKLLQGIDKLLHAWREIAHIGFNYACGMMTCSSKLFLLTADY